MEYHPAPHKFSQIVPKYLTRHAMQAHTISRLLHDELSQSMTALRLQLALLEMETDHDENESQSHIHTSITMVEEMIEQLRKASHMLYPTALDAADIGQAISDTCQRVADQTQISITYHDGYGDPLPNFLQVLLYRFAQEAVSLLAAIKDTRHISVSLEQDAEKVILSVQALRHLPDTEISPETIIYNDPVIEDIQDEISLLGGSFRVKAGTDLVTYIGVFLPLPEDL